MPPRSNNEPPPTSRLAAGNRLTAVKDGTNYVARYAYDGMTRRTVKQAYDSSGTLIETRHYYFSDQWQVVREMVSGSTAALYIWGLRYVDELLVRYDPTYGRKYAMQDANFNCTSICDDALSSGTVDERYQYDPYAGNRIILDSSWNVISASAYNWTVGHQGLMFETEVGIYNCRNRVYLPMMGTWMQRDPLGYADGMGLYEYVGNLPTSSRDPNGFAQESCDQYLSFPPGNPGQHPWPEHCCCEWYWKRRANRDLLGKTLCCNRKPVTCLSPGLAEKLKRFEMSENLAQQALAQKLINDCVLKHEEVHARTGSVQNRIDCSRCPDIGTCDDDKLIHGDKFDSDCAECEAWREEVRCLASAITNPNCESRCRALVNDRYKRVTQQMMGACDKCEAKRNDNESHK